MDCTTTDVSQGTDTLEKHDKATVQDFLYQVLLFCLLLNEMLRVSLSSVLGWQGTFLCGFYQMELGSCCKIRWDILKPLFLKKIWFSHLSCYFLKACRVPLHSAWWFLAGLKCFIQGLWMGFIPPEVDLCKEIKSLTSLCNQRGGTLLGVV